MCHHCKMRDKMKDMGFDRDEAVRMRDHFYKKYGSEYLAQLLESPHARTILKAHMIKKESNELLP